MSLPSLDKVCAGCGLAKPPIAFDHSDAAKGAHRDLCQPCVTRLHSRSVRRWKASPAGQRSQRASHDRRIRLHPEQAAAGAADWLARFDR